eukprot:2015200-Pyramimonas_sp.AAC.2
MPEEAHPIIWDGERYARFGAAGVIGHILREIAEDPAALKLLKGVDQPRQLAELYVHGMLKLLRTAQGAKHAAVRARATP